MVQVEPQGDTRLKFETLAKRLAVKTQTPNLEDVLLGRLEPVMLPSTCMVWTGTRSHDGGKSRIRRNSVRGQRVYPQVTYDKSYAIIKYQRRQVHVQRLIYQILEKPDYEFSLYQQCPTLLCVNPRHWIVERKYSFAQVPVVVTKAEIDESLIPAFDGSWTVDDVAEIIEIALEEISPKSFEALMSFPDLADAPHEMVRSVLIGKNLEHLT